MRQKIFYAVFAIVCVVLAAVSCDSVSCHSANKMLRAKVKAQAEKLQESTDTMNINVLVYGRIK